MKKGWAMKILIALMMATFVFIGCTSKDSLKKTLKENPDILAEAIEANPDVIVESLNKAFKGAQAAQAKKREEQEKKALEESFEKPLTAQIRSDELFRGNKNGAITIIEYSDFECPFCARGYNTVMSLLKKYKGNVRFVYKHLPLSFHPQAMIASQYYEAIRMQSEKKAIKFHDEIYENQRKLQGGEKFLKSLAKKVGANMAKLAKDVNSDKVKNRIKEDMDEAAKYGFQGTPGFLVNGVPVKGAYPESHFDNIINELKKRGKIKI
jgi:protein-disulfide isomerase